MAIEAVLFDWGGTLTQGWLAQEELGDLWRLAAEHLAVEAGRPDDVTLIAERLTEVELAAWDRAIDTGRSFRIAELLADASTSLGLDVAAAVRDEAAVRHLDAWAPHVRHRPEAGEVLGQLRDRAGASGSCRIRIGRVRFTNGSSNAMASVDASTPVATHASWNT